MIFRMQLPLLVEKPGAALSGTERVMLDVVFERGRWRGQCQDPPVATLMCDSLEEALVSAAREVLGEWSRDVEAGRQPTPL